MTKSDPNMISHGDSYMKESADKVEVSIGTANFINPRVAMDILAGMEDYPERRVIADVNDIVGTLKED